MKAAVVRSQDIKAIFPSRTPHVPSICRKPQSDVHTVRRQSKLACTYKLEAGPVPPPNLLESDLSPPKSRAGHEEVLESEKRLQGRDPGGAEVHEMREARPSSEWKSNRVFRGFGGEKSPRKEKIIFKNAEYSDQVKKVKNEFVTGVLEDDELIQVTRKVLAPVTKLLIEENGPDEGIRFVERLNALGNGDDHIMAISLKRSRKHGNSLELMERVSKWFYDGAPVGPGCGDVVIKALSEEKNLRMACEMLVDLQDFGITLRPFAFNILILAAGMEGEIAIATKVFKWLIESETTPDGFSFRNVLWAIRGRASTGHFIGVYETFVASNLPLDRHVYFAFMTCASTCGCLRIAEKIFDEFAKTDNLGFRTSNTFNLFLEAHTKCVVLPDIDKIVDLFDSHNVPMDKFSFGSLLTAASRVSPSMENLDRILAEMDKRGVPMNHVTGPVAILAYSKAHMDPFPERFATAVRITRTVKTQRCYHFLMSIACYNGHLGIALRVKREMEEAGYAPNFHTYDHLYKACQHAGLANQAETFLQLREAFEDDQDALEAKRPLYLKKKKKKEKDFRKWKSHRKWVERKKEIQRFDPNFVSKMVGD